MSFIVLAAGYMISYNVRRPKHPLKVNVWADISLCGPTKICIFEGIMDGPMFIYILCATLLPFIAEIIRGVIDLHRIMTPSILFAGTIFL